jgi:hypothetical protein
VTPATLIAATVLLGAGCGSASTAIGTGRSRPTTAYSAGRVPRSAPIRSTAYRHVLAQAFGKNGVLDRDQAAFAAQCVQRGLEAAGFRTQGELEGANSARAATIIQECAQRAAATR